MAIEQDVATVSIDNGRVTAPPVPGWSLRSETRFERPTYISAEAWRRITSVRENPRTPLVEGYTYLHGILDRLSAPAGAQTAGAPEVPDRSGGGAKYSSSNFIYAGSLLSTRSKEDYVQQMALHVATLRTVYQTENGGHAVNIYAELLSLGSHYQMDFFKADPDALRPSIRGFAAAAHDYKATPGHIVRVADEIRRLATPLPAIEFHHVMGGGSPRGYRHPDLDKALVAEKHAAYIAQELSSGSDFHSGVISRLQLALDSGRPFEESTVYAAVMRGLHHELDR